jgi:hypothetical protein
VFLDTGAGKGGALAWRDLFFDNVPLDAAQGHAAPMTD